MTKINDLNLECVLVGVYFGYPECCIEFFANRLLSQCFSLTKAQKAVHNHEGFIPCVRCAEKVYSGIVNISDLIKDRYCVTPYPQGGWDEDIDLFIDFMKTHPLLSHGTN